MTTSEVLANHAVKLVEKGTETEEAVGELLLACDNRRVAVVMAKQHFIEQSADHPEDKTAKVIELLDEVLERFPEV